MSFIGIIADEKSENYIRSKLLEKLNLNESNVLFIKEKTIENIKNIKFETVLLAREFKSIASLKKVLASTKYLVVNTDLKDNLKLLGQLDLTLITYGFNSKSTITISSVVEDRVLICLQRSVTNVNKQIIEAQEIEIKADTQENINNLMAITAFLLIYGKII